MPAYNSGFALWLGCLATLAFFLHEKTLSLTEINQSAGSATAQSRGTLALIIKDNKKAMKFLPTENITYKTRLKEDEIIRRLSDCIEPEKTFRFGIFSSGSTKSYEGKINGQTFNIKRIISYRNSFLPRINGVIERDFDGLTIKVKMRLHTFVIVFLCI